MSIPEKIQREVASLRKAIERHNKLYHSLDNPEIPDADYDLLVERLEGLERKYALASDSSPSSSVGFTPLPKISEVHHQIPMLSMRRVLPIRAATSARAGPLMRWMGSSDSGSTMAR